MYVHDLNPVYGANLQDIMDDGGDATTHKHSLPHEPVITVYMVLAISKG